MRAPVARQLHVHAFVDGATPTHVLFLAPTHTHLPAAACRHSRPDVQQQALLLCCQCGKGSQLPIRVTDLQMSAPLLPARTPTCMAWAWRQ